MKRIGLTGGIASGKSTVSERLAELGAVVIDADLLAREVVRPGTPGLAAVVRQFGNDVLTGDGSLDRQALARRVFDDDDARRRLEAVIHPLVRQRTAEIEAALPRDAVVVHDIPLLVESGQDALFDAVVVIDVDEDVQRRRLRELRHMPDDEAVGRIAAQTSRERRLAAADAVIVNNGSRADLLASVDRLWQDLTA
ncbi:MAG: dephospho-CoA kinase [Nocardioidaceae bacterium]|nr:dephospho-CoA kinase [Nocardioidaceae bacterium]